jgi:hypothetical protein
MKYNSDGRSDLRMRIGNLEEVKSTETTENLIQLIQSEETKHLSGIEKYQNWWHYYKWYVICGVILLGIACDLAVNALKLWQPIPDFQIAYVGETALPDNTINALENAFALLGEDLYLDLDFNRDGKIIVKINQYASNSLNPDSDAHYYETASEINLIGDISDGDSYFFLLENPDNFQQEHQLLANPDGSCPSKTDNSIAGKVLSWSDCSALSDMELGTYSTNLFGQNITGDNQELLSKLYIGRRCFYTEPVTDNAEQCSALWNVIATQ